MALRRQLGQGLQRLGPSTHSVGLLPAASAASLTRRCQAQAQHRQQQQGGPMPAQQPRAAHPSSVHLLQAAAQPQLHPPQPASGQLPAIAVGTLLVSSMLRLSSNMAPAIARWPGHNSPVQRDVRRQLKRCIAAEMLAPHNGFFQLVQCCRFVPAGIASSSAAAASTAAASAPAFTWPGQSGTAAGAASSQQQGDAATDDAEDAGAEEPEEPAVSGAVLGCTACSQIAAGSCTRMQSGVDSHASG